MTSNSGRALIWSVHWPLILLTSFGLHLSDLILGYCLYYISCWGLWCWHDPRKPFSFKSIRGLLTFHTVPNFLFLLTQAGDPLKPCHTVKWPCSLTTASLLFLKIGSFWTIISCHYFPSMLPFHSVRSGSQFWDLPHTSQWVWKLSCFSSTCSGAGGPLGRWRLICSVSPLFSSQPDRMLKNF